VFILAAIFVALALQVPSGAEGPQHGSGAEPAGAEPAGAEEGHHDPIAPVLIPLIVILIGAKFGGEIFARLGQPAVLGELIVGVLIGNLDYLVGFGIFEEFRSGETHHLLRVFASLGVLILLFEAGLESNLQKMIKVGGTALSVALVGVVAPWFLGYGVGLLLLPNEPFQVHLFIGAILTATSVGITARVYKDLGRIESDEARIILGAAVIDDILGLIILATMSGMVMSGAVSAGAVIKIVAISTLFLAASIFLGTRFAGWISKFFALFRVKGMKLALALTLCFLFSYISGRIGLATIVGAFAAGLILEEATFTSFRGERPLHELIDPISSIFVPIFFVLMGIDVRIEAFANLNALALAAAITVAALIGKQVCGLVVRERGLDRLSIGIGMIPRGEVGLIFAGVGRGLGVVNDTLYAACVIMVIVTTFVAPLALQITTRRFDRKRAAAGS
jgi:Kef-type K+ transport system membrane component KefB